MTIGQRTALYVVALLMVISLPVASEALGTGPVTLGTPTYDGSGQTVHPDIVFVPNGFGSGKWPYWMAVTPYPGGNDAYENPSILVSENGLRWQVPPGLKNPLIARPPFTKAHNSDPDMLLVGDEMYLYYRESLVHVTPAVNTIKLIRSKDGITWSAPVDLLGPDKATLASPAVVYDGTRFTMFYIDYPQMKMRTSRDGISWDEPLNCNVQGLAQGRYPWHLDVVRNQGRLESLFVSVTASGGTDSRMHYAYSEDNGKTWTVAPPFREKTESFEMSLQYRGSLLQVKENPPTYDIWYSARSTFGTWRVAYMQMVRKDNQLYPVE